jgi:hypothetical protein
MIQSTDNELFDLAAEVIRYTSSSLFLTGKAGTGKTTFLKFIREYSNKNNVVVAPTGVAAINAGGVTMHSFFQLPFNPYLPSETTIFGNNATVDKHGLLRNIKFSREKIELINELELLIIDEVSMVRADALQAIDDILRYYRRADNKPFGGVQVLLIGDLFQLPPVVSEQEWELMNRHYKTPFFFSARVMEETPPLFIELKKIYRQNEQAFIDLLNNIRHNIITQADLNLLQGLYQPDRSDNSEHIITLTTHNRVADHINQTELKNLPGQVYSFNGIIDGDFPDKALPADLNLTLKPGAQVMFIKNDSSQEKRYYNGRLATVKRIYNDEVTVTFNDNNEEFEVAREQWTNIRYTLNKESNKLEEEEVGSYRQYPLRLAWAITIHKSQGLTFDKICIDAGSSFAAGQVYVALSRCRTLQGIQLLSRISAQSIKSDDRIVQFSALENNTEQIRQRLAEEKPVFAAQLLIKTFDWRKLIMALEHYYEEAANKKLPEQQMIIGVATGLLQRAKTQQETADKFVKQLDAIIKAANIDGDLLNERVTKAKLYFGDLLTNELIKPVNSLQEFLKGKVRVKQFSRATDELEGILWKKLHDVQRITFGEFTFEVPVTERMMVKPKKTQAAGTSKEPKGSTMLQTLEFYKQGMNVNQIAAQRGITTGTVENHLADFVASGEVNIFDFLSQAQLDEIEQATRQAGFGTYTAVKQKVHESITYSQIRMAFNYLKARQGQNTTLQ